MHRRIALALGLALTASLLTLASHRPAPPQGYRVHALRVTTHVAPEGGPHPATCVVDADLYVPRAADHRHPAPALLMTNGYGGSKAHVGGLAASLARRGYVVLAYSGLGFGTGPGRHGSGCQVTFDDREHDGLAAKQLVDFLGGLRPADDGTRVDYVLRDRVAHDGRRHAGDVRIGMVGGSYGGQVQFAAAAVDPRIDTIVPLITWNDFAYSLTPNDAALGDTSVDNPVPGAQKVEWTQAFLGRKVPGAPASRSRPGPCPAFSDEIRRAIFGINARGYADDVAHAAFRAASVTSYASQVRVPVLLGQGETDPLFPLREAIATYSALRAHGTPVRMLWQQWGHAVSPLPGEYSTETVDGTYEGGQIVRWLDYWLKHTGRRPALDFTYYAHWRDHGDVSRAFVSAPSYPLPGTTTLWASGGALLPSAARLAPGRATLTASPWAPGTGSTRVVRTAFVTGRPGSSAVLSTPPLLHDLDVVGAPRALLRLSSPTASAARPESMLVAFVKLYDVAPDGSVDPATRLVAAIRVGDLSKPVDVALPALAHRFAAGHRMQLVVSLTDPGYQGNAQGQVVTLTTSAAAPTALVLPGRQDPGAFPAG